MDRPKPNKPYELDEVDRQWGADGAKVLARVAQGDCHLDNEGWWVETSTGNLIGIDPQTDRPLLSDKEAEQWRRNARPFSEACPELHASIKPKVGRPKSENPKQIVTIRLDRDLLERLKADGAGWQTRLNAILRKAMGLK